MRHTSHATIFNREIDAFLLTFSGKGFDHGVVICRIIHDKGGDLVKF
jgi:hypothetical protein